MEAKERLSSIRSLTSKSFSILLVAFALAVACHWLFCRFVILGLADGTSCTGEIFYSLVSLFLSVDQPLPLPLPIALWSMFMRFNLPIYDPCCWCAIYNSYGHEYVNSCLKFGMVGPSFSFFSDYVLRK